MIQLYPEQLADCLNERLDLVYLLHGNDNFLIQEGLNTIYRSAMARGFKERYVFRLESNVIDWQEIFHLCRAKGIFSKKKILQIILPNIISSVIGEKISILSGLLHNDLLLIIQINRLLKEKKKPAWFKTLTRYLILITCKTPEKEDLIRWVSTRAKKNHLQLEDTACHFLCYCHEGNLLALAQELDQFKLLWPDEKITLSHVKQIVKNSFAHFTPFHWIDALLESKDKRALRILKHFRLEGYEPVILLRILQRELLLFLNLKRQSKYQTLCLLFNKFHIWENRRSIMEETLGRLSQDKLRQAIHILTRAELFLKQNQDIPSVWLELDNLSIFLCHESLPNIFTDDLYKKTTDVYREAFDPIYSKCQK